MYFWNVLEIDPTDDTTLIKKAYAKKLKIYHPETDPMGYQLLREAYDCALKYAKDVKLTYERNNQLYRENENKPVANTDISGSFNNGPLNQELKIGTDKLSFSNHIIPNTEQTMDIPPHLNLNQINTVVNLDFNKLIDNFIEQAEDLYRDFPSRIDKSKWKILFENDIVWNIDAKILLNRKMFLFISHHHFFPRDIWRLLDDHFNWSNQTYELRQDFTPSTVNYIIKMILLNKDFNYDIFVDVYDEKIEEFLDYREKAFFALMENNLVVAKYNIDDAKAIFSNDPDLMLIDAELSIKSKDYDTAQSTLSKLIEMKLDNLEIINQINILKKSLQSLTRSSSKNKVKAKINIVLKFIVQALACIILFSFISKMSSGDPVSQPLKKISYTELSPKINFNYDTLNSNFTNLGVTFKKIIPLDLMSFSYDDKKGNRITTYISLVERVKLKGNVELNGVICLGEINNNYTILVASIPSYNHIKNNKQYYFQGVVKKIPAQILNYSVNDKLRSMGLADKINKIGNEKYIIDSNIKQVDEFDSSSILNYIKYSLILIFAILALIKYKKVS